LGHLGVSSRLLRCVWRVLFSEVILHINELLYILFEIWFGDSLLVDPMKPWSYQVSFNLELITLFRYLDDK